MDRLAQLAVRFDIRGVPCPPHDGMHHVGVILDEYSGPQELKHSIVPVCDLVEADDLAEESEPNIAIFLGVDKLGACLEYIYLPRGQIGDPTLYVCSFVHSKRRVELNSALDTLVQAINSLLIGHGDVHAWLLGIEFADSVRRISLDNKVGREAG